MLAMQSAVLARAMSISVVTDLKIF